jgi:outer membrane protein assembly factor BamB
MLLCCLDAQTGKELWRANVQKDYAGERPQCGSAESPVVDGDLVIVAGGGPGQSILAFNKNTGKVVWKSEDATNQYSTPKLATILGERQVVFYTKNDLMGISVKDGKRLWRQAVTFHGHNCAQPIVCEDKVYCGAMTDGAGVYQVVKEDDGTFHSRRLWINPMEDSTCMSSLVLKDGYLYGQLGIYKGNYGCLDFASGKVMWKQKGLGNGSVILVDDKLVFLSQRGALILVDAKPEYKELARFTGALKKGVCFSTPAFSNGRLYIRSSQEAACYDLTAR